jgi:hypothetical protein
MSPLEAAPTSTATTGEAAATARHRAAERVASATHPLPHLVHELLLLGLQLRRADDD